MITFPFSEKELLLCEIVASNQNEPRVDAALKLLELLGDETTLSFSKINEVNSIVAHFLIEQSNLQHFSEIWKIIHQNINERISAYLKELDNVAVTLANSEISLVALKNAGIARGIFPCPGCCPMGDIDVLIERKHFRQAHQLLLDNGYHFEFRSPLEETKLDAAEKSGGAEYWKVLANGEKLWLELQWRPIAGRWIRPDQEPSAEEMMSRSIPIPGTKVRLLCPEDNLLQVSLHTAKHTYVRAPGFRLHLDVDRIVNLQTVNWDVFLSRVLILKVKTPIYFSLAIPKSLFKTPIPEHILKALRPSRWKERMIFRWIRKAGIFNPNEKKFRKIGYILFNMLLYDDLFGLLKSLFPEKKWMIERYDIKSPVLLPYYHIKRLADLAFRRART